MLCALHFVQNNTWREGGGGRGGGGEKMTGRGKLIMRLFVIEMSGPTQNEVEITRFNPGEKK